MAQFRFRTHVPVFALFLFPFGMGQCASVPLSSVAVPALAPAAAPEMDPRFAAGLAQFRNGDTDGDGWRWDANEFADWALLGVTLVDDRGRDQVWFVRLSSLAEEEPQMERFKVSASLGPLNRGDRLTAPAKRVRIESFDRFGEHINTSHRTLPIAASDVNAGGMEALGRALAEGSQYGSETDAQSAEDLAKLSISLQEIGKSGALRPIRHAARKTVIHEPNILMLILNAFRINVRADFANAERMTQPWLPEFDVPQYVASSPLYIAGQHVLNCRVVLGPVGDPFALTAGVLGFEITHPDRPQNKLTVRLLATKPRQDG